MTDAQEWVERFPSLSRLELPIKQLLLSQSAIIEVPKRVAIFGPRNPPKKMSFLLDGRRLYATHVACTKLL